MGWSHAHALSDDSARQEAQRKTEELERLAFLDPLTQMPNRRFVEMSLQTAMQEYQLTNSPFGVLATDLNKLKTINDLFGHANGDRALREVAKMLAGHCVRLTPLGAGAATSFWRSSVMWRMKL